ncbi:MAG: CusA/CzcA family heavy metal efflux RND transporter [Cyclobacteriaceae bacterium]
MLENVIQFSLKNKLIVLLFTFTVIAFGVYSLSQIPIGAVPDITNNQVQVITTSRNLSTQDVEQFITYPVELEMANLPGVKEIRSVSKFGLSVVTIVFDDDLGTYLPRQLIAEKIISASEQIPKGFGTPQMGPITTGLGEIYQYVLDVAPEYKSKYTAMDLRTIQDWIVKRQLSGIPGVVEVNTWGGFLKQYEVSLNPEKLNAAGLSPIDVFTALEKNNSVAGGGYIEKGDQSYFIRGEGLVGSIKDIENIVIDSRNGIPVYVSDLAEVQFGYATRFGAVTANGEGEKVLGQVMMLKNANSKLVIEAVKDRVADISSSLPPGISINPFLERSALIAKTTFTITENLVLGCLIVIFVVVLLLGNLRSGLVVASIIPLCLLFAISLMYVFGIDANLMSLGAIDFGIIIDGAVIIVEFISFQITAKRSELAGVEDASKQSMIDKITYQGTTKMMRSAVFGQLIIVIVFIPILSLTDVEGKMFQPMALTFCFALIGAMIFCFTYVPVVASYFIRPSKTDNPTISKRLMMRFERFYEPIIRWALDHRKAVLGASLGLLASVGYLFSTMGGEFMPTLDEGDFVIQPILKTGTSLSKTVETTTKIENVVRRFPEVQQVVTRIGAAEVPTDPMSMEETDVMIILYDKGEWDSGLSKDELADRIKDALLAEIPGADYEFTQPIEMRFNELITGVRADLAIKVYGEDLSVLAEKASEIEQLIRDVEGAADISVEKVDGLPQMQVKYKRSMIAKYGLNIEDVNEVISMAFAGKVAGSIFEGERKFDLVVRFSQDFRKDITNIEETFVPLPTGGRVPMSSLAEIVYAKGPAQISRDDTKRRIVVGVNVRGRDLQSVVDDVQSIIGQNVTLPPGYLIDYGGQFENLQSARRRLAIAVPISLFLIFILLHFALGSAKEALMVYSAIPLSAVGGVLLLWLRDLPFSISAGVGFIALFGIAVLNGIVLIEHFKELKREGMDDIKERVLLGTKQRLRPVLLTATAAALGFLPMAISSSAGAEVQRPLATVVIGGLITATLLTLIVLPVLYSIFDEKNSSLKLNPKMLAWAVLLFPALTHAQTKELSLEDAIEIAKENNALFKSSGVALEKSDALIGTAFDFEKSNVYYSYDENNIALNNAPLKVWGIQQNFDFPSVYGAQKKLLESQSRMQRNQHAINERLLIRQVSQAYDELLYLASLKENYQFLDSIYTRFANAADRRYELGESNYLEKLNALSRQNEVRLLLSQSESEVKSGYIKLSSLLQSDDPFEISEHPFAKLSIMPIDTANHPSLLYYKEALTSVDQAYKVEKSKLLPGIQLEYFQGNNNAANAQSYQGFQIGLGIPILFGGSKSRILAGKLEKERLQYEADDFQITLNSRFQQLRTDLTKQNEALLIYEQTGKQLAAALIDAATKGFQSGEIDFFQYVQSMDQAVKIEINYLNGMRQYNRTVLEINYFTN